MNNLALYAEESFKYLFNNRQFIHFVGGIRNDYTFIKGSNYGNVSAVSPRFNMEYNIINASSNTYIKKLSGYVGWGQSIKLPSFGVLYTRPSYYQRMAFVPGSLNDGTTYYAYYIQPNKVLQNKALKWQKSEKLEVGIRGKIKNTNFSLMYFNTLGKYNYTRTRQYSPFTYYLTTPNQLVNVAIPAENRRYTIDQEGTVTVHDNRGVLSDEVLDKKEKQVFKNTSYADNGSPVKRQGIEWIVDFGKIRTVNTSIRLDGAYYYYKFLNKKIIASSFNSQLMSDGSDYKYIAYYYGGSSVANGVETKTLTANATLKTHIPKLKLVVTLKIEGTLINSSQALSEMPGGERAFEMTQKGDYIPKQGRGSIYKGNNFVCLYPLYYTTFNDLQTKIPFWDKYVWAYENNKTLFNDLTKMVKTSNYDYQFKKDEISPYLSANINVSKEIGQHLKLTFYARNFFNNIAKVKEKRTNTELSLLNSGLVPDLSYGVSFKVIL